MKRKNQKNQSEYPQFPLYVPTKGRSQYMMTTKSLMAQGVDHYLVVEEQEYKAYADALESLGLDKSMIVVLDNKYKENYEHCDDLGLTKSSGPGPARNFAWDHSISEGHKWHWVMDDNIRSFMRFNNNLRIKVSSPSFWRIMEDFVLRYKNVVMAGPNYKMFAFVPGVPPFVANTRIYSCNLIRNDIKFRWRGRYNEDTIISLDILKAGLCTIQFNAFLQDKIATQTMKGGNTEEFYHAEGKLHEGKRYSDRGTLAKSQMLVKVHPDVARLVWKYDRWHHHVDYTGFKNIKLIKKDGLKIKEGTNERGLLLKKKDDVLK